MSSNAGLLEEGKKMIKEEAKSEAMDEALIAEQINNEAIGHVETELTKVMNASPNLYHSKQKLRNLKELLS